MPLSRNNNNNNSLPRTQPPTRGYGRNGVAPVRTTSTRGYISGPSASFLRKAGRGNR